MKRYYLTGGLSIFIFVLIFLPGRVSALEDFYLHFTTEAIQKGYTAEFNRQDHPEWGNFRVGIVPNLVNEPIDLVLKKFNGDNLPNPEGLRRVSDYYIYDILREDQADKEPLELNRPFVISIKLSDIKNYYRKRIYYWSKPAQSWVPLPSSADYDNGYIRAYTHLPFSRVAIFEDSSEIENWSIEGRASWFRSSRYRYGAASNDYPLGTRLRVRNVDNGQIVDVEIISTGPFFPFSDRRVLDLTLPAFEQIEERWKGVARVQAWPIGEGVKVLGVDTYSLRENDAQANALVPEPNLQAKAAIAINEKTGEIIYSKNYDTVLPIASLTKLMTAVVFLETNTPMDKVVMYESGDSAIGSRLYITHGETLTVKDLYYSMLVGSANNASNALARSTGLSREEFIKRMNETAAAWGLTHTKFVDVNGLDPANVSTVYDLAIMSKKALQDYRILQGTTTPVYGFRTINTNQPHTIKSSAKGVFETKIIDNSLFITGMKTGYLDEAGYCFMLKARPGKDDDNHVITVILGADSADLRYQETNDLMLYALGKI